MTLPITSIPGLLHFKAWTLPLSTYRLSDTVIIHTVTTMSYDLHVILDGLHFENINYIYKMNLLKNGFP